MAQTPEQYYDPQNGSYGNYQYLALSEVINDFILQSHDNESYLYGLPRHLLVRHAKAALKDLHREVVTDVKAVELTLGEDYMFPLPQDYVDYIRVSVVTENNTLEPLDINTRLNVATTYLQDNEYKIIFDDAGQVIEADGENLVNKPYRSFPISMRGNGGKFQEDTSRLSKFGEFTIDQREGIMYFGTSLAGRDIVVEYVSDGMEWERLKETEITFHKHLKQPLEDLIYHNCIERRRNVPANEKQRAKMQFKASKHQAKIKAANFDFDAISRVWRKGMKWVKS